jgi:hypothetical protein
MRALYETWTGSVIDDVDFQPIRMLTALSRGGVDYVVIGGVGARLVGSPAITRDLDICYARDETNLEALAVVLRGLHARLRGVDVDVPFRMDARSLRAGDSFTFSTDGGDLDVLGTPAGTSGYEDLVRTADAVEVEGFQVLVASVDDLIRMKRAAARPKDRQHIELLAAVRDEIDAGR